MFRAVVMEVAIQQSSYVIIYMCVHIINDSMTGVSCLWMICVNNFRNSQSRNRYSELSV